MRMRFLAAVLTGFSLVFMAACASSTTPDATLLSAGDLRAPDSALETQTDEVHIKAYDRIAVALLEYDKVNGEYSVDQNGYVKIPLIGSVSAAGFTENEFARVLEAEFEKDHLQTADVTVTIEESLEEHLTVDGEVEDPGVYPIAGRQYLLQAIAEAGGPTAGADISKVLVFRTIQGENQAALFDLSEIRSGRAEDPIVYANDKIVVGGSTIRKQYGNVLDTLTALALILRLAI